MLWKRIAAIAFLLTAISYSPAAKAGCTSYSMITNGTTADAGQVMNNFNCAILTSGSNATGATFNSITLTGLT